MVQYTTPEQYSVIQVQDNTDKKQRGPIIDQYTAESIATMGDSLTSYEKQMMWRKASQKKVTYIHTSTYLGMMHLSHHAHVINM